MMKAILLLLLLIIIPAVFAEDYTAKFSAIDADEARAQPVQSDDSRLNLFLAGLIMLSFIISWYYDKKGK